MGKSHKQNVSCSNCGHGLDPSWAELSRRPACPACGEKGIAIEVGIVSEIETAGSVNVGMHPQSTDRGWRRRWIELENQWAELQRPITETMSGQAINGAHHRLQAFYVQAYHLKDALRNDAASGINKKVVESTISSDARLALLADLANLDKHFRLSNPRSGDVPTIACVRGIGPGSGERWRLDVQIMHRGQIRDAIDIAGEAMDAWKQHLLAWRRL